MKKQSIGVYIIGSAIIWGAVILGCSFKLKGADAFKHISLILSTGAGILLLLIWGPVAVLFKKFKMGE